MIAVGRRDVLGLGAGAAAAAVLSACTPRLAPPGPVGPGGAAPRLTAEAAIMDDGARLPLRRWARTDDPLAVLIALHGFNDYGNAYGEAGPVLANRGLIVWAPDQRGFGAGPHRGLWAGRERMADDLRALVGLARETWPGRRVLVLGESMGGAVAMVAAADPADRLDIDGLILVAPAVWGRSTMPWAYRAVLDLTAALAPWMRVSGKGLDIWPSDNIEMLRTLGRDPMMIRDTRADTIAGLVDLMDAALMAAPRVPPPLLVMTGANDQIIPAEPTLRALRAMVGDGTDPTRRAALYRDGWHMLLRDLGGTVPLEDIAAWAADPTLPLPSGADATARAVLAGRLSMTPRQRPSAGGF